VNSIGSSPAYWPYGRCTVPRGSADTGADDFVARLPGIARLPQNAPDVAALIVASAHPLFAKIYEEFQFKKVYSHEIQFRHVVETKSGVVTVTMDGTVFGGGVYDGQFHTELIHDTNMIIRAYAVSAFHPAPRTMPRARTACPRPWPTRSQRRVRS